MIAIGIDIGGTSIKYAAVEKSFLANLKKSLLKNLLIILRIILINII